MGFRWGAALVATIALLLGGCGRLGFETVEVSAFSIADCKALAPAPNTSVVVGPSEVSTLVDLLINSAPGTTILLQDGIYDLSGLTELLVTVPGLTLRSESGNPSGVVLDHVTAVNRFLKVRAGDVTIAELSTKNLGLDVEPSEDPTLNAQRLLLYRVVIADSGEHPIFMKGTDDGRYPDDGTLACSTLRVSDVGRQRLGNVGNSFAGVRAYGIRGWTFYANRIEGFYASGTTGRGLHISGGSRDVLIEHNEFFDNTISLQLGHNANAGSGRQHTDEPCGSGYWEYVDGVVRNNTVLTTPALTVTDASTAFWSVCGTVVVHNTVASTGSSPASVEWRFSETDFLLRNNLLSHGFRVRDGADSTMGDDEGNIVSAGLTGFVDAAAGNLRPNAPTLGVALPSGQANIDLDNNDRNLAAPTVGAYEFIPPQ